MTMRSRSFLLLLAVGTALSGCTVLPGAGQWTVPGEIAPEGLPAAPRVVAQGGALEVTVLEPGSGRGPETAGSVAAEIATCFVLLNVGCPVVLAAGAVVVAPIIAFKALTEVTDKQARFAPLFERHAASAALARRIEAAVAASAREYPRLEVKMESALVDVQGAWSSVTLTAKAQAFPAPGVEWPATSHLIRLAPRHTSNLLADDGALLVEELAPALEELSESILAAYLPARAPTSPRSPAPDGEAPSPAFSFPDSWSPSGAAL